MEEKQKLSKDLINFFVENLKNRRQEKLEKKKFEVKKNFTLGEEIFNSIVHGIGALLSIAGLVLLIIKAEGPKEVVGVTIFASTAIVLYTMSCLYHAFPNGRTKNVFERFDHSSIYLLIAGTYTAFCFTVFDGPKGWVLFGIQWGLALIGIILKSIWVDRFVIIHVIIFLLMGWEIIYLVTPLIQLLNEMPLAGFMFLLSGGICYSIGTLFYVFSWFKFHHVIWHFFVLFGTLLHFFCVFFYVL